MYNEGDLQKIGANIRLMRAIRGIGQSEMAKALGISQTHMSNIEHNRASANLRLLLKAANVFQCSLDDFLQVSFAVGNSNGSSYSSYSLEEICGLLEKVQSKKESAAV